MQLFKKSFWVNYDYDWKSDIFTVKLKLHNTSYNFNRIILCWDQRKKGKVVFQNFLGFWERQ